MQLGRNSRVNLYKEGVIMPEMRIKSELSDRGGGRELWCDFIRCIAIFAVILNHSVEFVCSINTSEQYLSIPDKYKGYVLALFLIGRIAGVPLFLFLSGYLLLKKDITKDSDAFAFYKHNLVSLVVTTELWIMLLSPIIHYYYPSYGVKEMIYGMLMLKQIPYMQFWYVPFIVGVYIGIPFLITCTKTYSFKYISAIWIIVFFIFIIANTIRFFTNIEFVYPIQLDSSLFMGGIAFLYLEWGYYIGSKKEQKNHLSLIGIGVIVLFFISIQVQDYFYKSGQDAKIGYDILPSFCCSCLLFIFLKYVGGKIELINKPRYAWFAHVCERLSRLSFGAYFLHAIVQDIIRRGKWFSNVTNPIFKILLLFVLSTSITFFVLFAISLNKHLSKLLLNNKEKEVKT